MGLFSGIGSVLGGAAGFLIGGPGGAKLGAGIGGALGGGIDGERAKSAQKAAKKGQFVQLRKAAERGGFNPLTALGAVGTGGFASASVAPLASQQAIIDGLRSASDVLTGDDAVRRETRKAELELARIELDRAKAGLSGPQARSQPPVRGGVPSLQAGQTATPLQRAAAVNRGIVPADPASAVTEAAETIDRFERFGLSSGRDIDRVPAKDAFGITNLEFPGFGDVSVISDGEEVADIGTLLAIGVQAPFSKFADSVFFPGSPENQRFSRQLDKDLAAGASKVKRLFGDVRENLRQVQLGNQFRDTPRTLRGSGSSDDLPENPFFPGMRPRAFTPSLKGN